MKVRNFTALLLKSTNPEEEITISVDGKKLPFTISVDAETNEKVLVVSTKETKTVTIEETSAAESKEETVTEKTSPSLGDLSPLNSEGDLESKKDIQVKKGK